MTNPRRSIGPILVGIFLAVLSLFIVGGVLSIIAPFIDAPNRYDLLVVNLETGDNYTIDAAHDILDDAAWSPHNTHLAYTKKTFRGLSIYLQAIDKEGSPSGKPEELLTKNVDGMSSILWSPDGESIAYIVYGYAGGEHYASSQLYIMDLETLTERQITNFDVRHASWSPDGSKIAANVYRSATAYSVLIFDVETGEGTYIGSNSDYRPPSWSPDGQWLAFINKEASTAAYIVSWDGSSSKKINTVGIRGNIQWSPDGTQITYETGDNGNSDISFGAVEADSHRALSDINRFDTCPRWGVDSTTLYFTSSEYSNGGFDIMAVNVSGGEPTELYHFEDKRGCPGFSHDRRLVALYKHMRGTDPME